MALWKKITALAFGVMLLFMSVSVMTLVQLQAKSLQQSNEEYAQRELLSFCTNVSLAVEQQEKEYSISVGRSMVQYYFAKAAGLLQSEEQYYSLAQEGQYLYHRGPVMPIEVYAEQPQKEQAESVSVENSKVWVCQTEVAEKSYLIAGTTFEAGGQDFGAYFSLDVSKTRQQIRAMWCIGVFVLVVASASGAIAIALLIRHKLRPLSTLTKTAQAISEGNYRLRTGYEDKDEIGQLSQAFDNMAQAIEEKIAWLDGEIQKRQLLVGAVSHEIRTPLTTIMGYGDTLLRMPVNEAQRMECAEHIVEACKHAELTARKMMQLVSLYEEKTVEKSLNAVSDILQRLEEQFGERVEFVQEVEQIYGDRVLLDSLAQNLVQNALRASGPEECVQVAFLAGKEAVCIRVSDRGVGIEEAQIPLLTEAFYRVDKTRSRKTGGAGLGLTICKLITEAHGGALSITSELGKGTVVEATIAQPTI